MKSFIAVPAFIGAAFAAFIPRADDNACSPMGNSTAPKPSSNTVAGFTESAAYSSLANNVATPSGYELTMANRNCAISSTRYMMYVRMDSYDPSACAEVCSHHSGCDSFNIYVQRDPSVVPGPQCPNPSPIAVARCALYSEPVMQSECTNLGQHIGPVDANGEAFQVVIRGSNAYNKLSGVTVTKTVTTTTTTTTKYCDFIPRPTLPPLVERQATAPSVMTVTANASIVAVTADAPIASADESSYITLSNDAPLTTRLTLVERQATATSVSTVTAIRGAFSSTSSNTTSPASSTDNDSSTPTSTRTLTRTRSASASPSTTSTPSPRLRHSSIPLVETTMTL